MATTQRTTVVGVFPNLEQVERAVLQLRDAGFTSRQIGLIVKDPTKRDRYDRSALEEAAPDATKKATETGAVLGSVLGGILGASVAVVLPGIGPVILAAALAAAITSGAVAGSLVGHLYGLGLPKHEVEFFQKEFEAGRPLLTVETDDRYSEALAIMTQHGAYDASRAAEVRG